MRVAYILDFAPTYVLRELAEMAESGRCSPVAVLPADSSVAEFWKGISGAQEESLDVLEIPYTNLLTCAAGRLLRQTVPILLRYSLRHPVKMLNVLRMALEEGCFRYFCAGALVADALREREVELHHAHFAKDAAHVARWASLLDDIPYTVTTHARDIFVPESSDRLRQLLQAADRVVTISDFNAGYIEEQLGGEIASNVEVIRLGVSPKRLPKRSPDGSGVVCVASGLAEKKGVHVLLEAARLLASRGVRPKVTVIGEDRDGVELDRCRRAVESGPLKGMLLFPGMLPSAETLKALASAELCVMPSVRALDGDMDGIPVALMEAAAMGTPMVATRLSGIPELVVDGETGLLAEPGDPASLADAIGRALERPGDMAAMAERARGMVEERFNSIRNAGRLIDLFERVIGS